MWKRYDRRKGGNGGGSWRGWSGDKNTCYFLLLRVQSATFSSNRSDVFLLYFVVKTRQIFSEFTFQCFHPDNVEGKWQFSDVIFLRCNLGIEWLRGIVVNTVSFFSVNEPDKERFYGSRVIELRAAWFRFKDTGREKRSVLERTILEAWFQVDEGERERRDWSWQWDISVYLLLKSVARSMTRRKILFYLTFFLFLRVNREDRCRIKYTYKNYIIIWKTSFQSFRKIQNLTVLFDKFFERYKNHLTLS